MKKIRIDCEMITGWQSFHDYFRKEFGFPSFYGENINAWIDCMSSLDEEGDGLSALKVKQGSFVVLLLENVAQLAEKQPEIYHGLLEFTAFVNYRRMEQGSLPVLILAFHK